MPRRRLEEAALRQESLNSAFGQIVAEIWHSTKRYTLWYPSWFSHIDSQTENVQVESKNISFRKYFL